MKLALLLLAFAAGCASYADGNRGDAFDTAAPTDSTDATADDTGTSHDSGDTTPSTPAWFAVEATLAVVGGQAATESAAVLLTVVEVDLSTRLCELPLDVAGLAPAEAAADGVPLWWSLPVVADEPCADLPATLRLGIGPIVANLRAELGAVELDLAGDSLYGSFIVVDEGAAAAFGVAGTATDYAGETVAAETPPDGLYEVRPLYLVPLGKQGGGAGP